MQANTYWQARVLNTPDPPWPVLIQDPEGPVYSLKMWHPDIWAIAIYIRNLPGVHRMATIDPMTDSRHTRNYSEYRFITFPF